MRECSSAYEGNYPKGYVPPTERHFSNILPVTGNNEVRAILNTLMDPAESYTETELYHLVREAHTGGYTPLHRKEPRQHVELDFVPKGLASIEDGDGSVSYRKTDVGSLATSLDGHMLRFSEKRNDYTLQSFLGVASAPGATYHQMEVNGTTVAHRRTAPFSRYRIMGELLALDPSEDQPVSANAIAKALGEAYPLVGSHVRTLAEKKIISLRSRKPDKAFARYTAVDGTSVDTVTNYLSYATLPRTVFELAVEMTRADVDVTSKSVLDQLIAEDPTKEQNLRSRSFRSRISGVLKHLSSSGHLDRVDPWTEAQSMVWLTDEQKGSVEELVQIVDDFRAGDAAFMAEGRRLAQEITSNPERVSRLITKSLSRSPYVGRTPKEALRAAIQNVVATSDDETTFTPRTITRKLSEEGIVRSPESTSAALKAMRDDGVVEPRSKGSAYHYGRVLEPDEEVHLYEEYLMKKYGERPKGLPNSQ